MSIYLDTSLLISAFTNEVATDRARQWLRDNEAAAKLTSLWVEVELAAAISMKANDSPLFAAARDRFSSEIFAFLAESLVSVPIADHHYLLAKDLSSRITGLRAGDALHLAIAASNQASVRTLDTGMTKAAKALGIGCELV